MRVAMFTANSFPPLIGRLHREAKSLILNGYDVDLYCVQHPTQQETQELDGISIFRVKKSPFWSAVNFLIGLSRELIGPFTQALLQHQKTTQVIYDVIHFHNPPDSLISCALTYRKKVNPSVKIVFDFHESVVPTLFQQGKRLPQRYLLPAMYWERKVLLHSDLLIVPSTGSRERLLANGVPKEKVLVLNNFVDLSIFNLKKGKGDEVRKRYQLKDHQVILYAGNLRPMRGMDVLVRSIFQLQSRFPKILLMVLGPENRYWKKMERLIRRLNLTDSVFFLPWMNYEEVPHYMAAADICVEPRRYTYSNAITSNSNKLFQYMAMKKPIVATEMESVTDFLDETCAVIVEPGNVASLAHGIAQLLIDPGLRERLSESAYQRCVENFSWPPEGQKLIMAYDQLAGNSPDTSDPVQA